MADSSTGAAGAAGDGSAGSAGAGGSSAAALLASAGAAGATGAAGPAAGATGATGAAAGAAGDWLAGVDPETKAWVDAKGFKTPADVLASQRNLEKLLGGDKIPKPKGDDDKAGWDQLYKSLGRPDKPDGYKLTVPEGSDDSMVKAFAPKMHELGLSQKQAAGLTDAWNAHAKGVAEAADKAKATASEADMVALKAEWGGQFEANVEQGRRAMRQFGLDADTLTAIEGGMGTGKMLRFMARLGGALAEDTGVNEGGKRGFATTKEQAVGEIATLRGDAQFMAAYMDARNPGHKQAVEKMERLHQVAHA